MIRSYVMRKAAMIFAVFMLFAAVIGASTTSVANASTTSTTTPTTTSSAKTADFSVVTTIQNIPIPSYLTDFLHRNYAITITGAADFTDDTGNAVISLPSPIKAVSITIPGACFYSICLPSVTIPIPIPFSSTTPTTIPIWWGNGNVYIELPVTLADILGYVVGDVVGGAVGGSVVTSLGGSALESTLGSTIGSSVGEYLGKQGASQVNGGWLGSDIMLQINLPGLGPIDGICINQVAAEASTIGGMVVYSAGMFAPMLSAISSQSSTTKTTLQQNQNGTTVSVPTTEYSDVIDLNKVKSLVQNLLGSSSMGSTVANDITSVQNTLGTSSIPLNLWTGNQGHLRQMSLELNLSNMNFRSLIDNAIPSFSFLWNLVVPTSVPGLGLNVTADFYNFGTSVSGTPPADPLTINITPLLKAILDAALHTSSSGTCPTTVSNPLSGGSGTTTTTTVPTTVPPTGGSGTTTTTVPPVTVTIPLNTPNNGVNWSNLNKRVLGHDLPVPQG
jgi:hypothetical protein